MKLLYLLPGNVRDGGLGEAEMLRRRDVLQANAFPGTVVEIADVATGPSSIESMYEEYQSVPGSVAAIVQAEKDGFDGVILGCAGDPGLDAAKEMVSIPVIGPGENSVLLAAQLGHHFSIITVMESIVDPLEHLVLKAGVDRKLASVRSVNVSVLDIGKDPDLIRRRALEEAKAARDQDRADTIVLGCMSMAFAQLDKEMSAELGIPVINPAIAALKTLESMVAMGISHSKKAFQTPPKLLK